MAVAHGTRPVECGSDARRGLSFFLPPIALRRLGLLLRVGASGRALWQYPSVWHVWRQLRDEPGHGINFVDIAWVTVNALQVNTSGLCLRSAACVIAATDLPACHVAGLVCPTVDALWPVALLPAAYDAQHLCTAYCQRLMVCTVRYLPMAYRLL